MNLLIIIGMTITFMSNPLHIKFSVDGEPQFSRVFDTMSEQIESIEPALLDISTDFFQHMMRVFKMEGAVDERTRWTPLSQSYAAWKRKHYPSAKILHLTGRLEKSLTEKGSPDNIMNLDKLTLSIGTRVPYALKHQRGVRGELPQRKIIDLTAPLKKRWTHIIHQHIYDKVKKTWGDARPSYR